MRKIVKEADPRYLNCPIRQVIDKVDAELFGLFSENNWNNNQ